MTQSRQSYTEIKVDNGKRDFTCPACGQQIPIAEMLYVDMNGLFMLQRNGEPFTGRAFMAQGQWYGIPNGE